MENYSLISVQQVWRWVAHRIGFKTYSVKEEIFSLPQLEEKIENSAELINENSFIIDFADEEWNYTFLSNKERYNKIISNWDDIAEFKDCFFI